MAEVHQDWSTHRIGERLRILLQLRSSALRERAAVRAIAFDAIPESGEPEIEPPAMTPRGSSPRQRIHLYSDLPPEDLLAVIEAMEDEEEGAPSALESPGDFLDSIARALEAIEAEEDARERRKTGRAASRPFSEKGLRARPVTSHRPERPLPANRSEALVRLAELDDEIADLEGRISTVRRILSRRAWTEGAARLQKLRASFDAELPGGVEAQRFFDVDEYVRTNRARLQLARGIAQKCGEAFPSSETDFRHVPRPMRDRLFRKIRNMS